ncbi:GNAT family N-acetyltransferase [Ascidiimonas aurantiaca]|uniref:GNAT family N-acetyltransferase n=1 Tax=Ascidiimonas aurantiaca TaxID=1685432 RepID=UPI0030EC213A
MFTITFIEEAFIEEKTIPFLQRLNPDTTEKVLKERLAEMLKNNYKCIGVYNDEKLIGISGLWILVKHYIGKHVEPDNVIILPEYRGKGIGKQLVKWIIDYAISINGNSVELNAYVASQEANKFWTGQGFKPVGYHYQMKLTS